VGGGGSSENKSTQSLKNGENHPRRGELYPRKKLGRGGASGSYQNTHNNWGSARTEKSAEVEGSKRTGEKNKEDQSR